MFVFYTVVSLLHRVSISYTVCASLTLGVKLLHRVCISYSVCASFTLCVHLLLCVNISYTLCESLTHWLFRLLLQNVKSGFNFILSLGQWGFSHLCPRNCLRLFSLRIEHKSESANCLSQVISDRKTHSMHPAIPAYRIPLPEQLWYLCSR